MKRNELFPSKYMKGIDLNDKSWTFTISHLRLEEMRNQQGEKEKKGVVYFKGPKKGLILTPTIFDNIVTATGQNDTDNWGGHLVTIFPATVHAFGKDNIVIRVRSAESTQAPDSLAHDEEEFDEDE